MNRNSHPPESLLDVPANEPEVHRLEDGPRQSLVGLLAILTKAKGD
ncbi:hypothetical protein EMIT0P291_130056 [Pseudomonas sp. IT-P291]